jgi:3'(2'), 5'-bisphosphate nucleotidase
VTAHPSNDSSGRVPETGAARAALLEVLIALVREAGDAVMRVYSRPIAVRHKADDSPVTEADLAAHRVLLEGLTPLEPRLPVLSEEGDAAGPERQSWAAHWLIDPLDGTKEFLDANGEFTINLALIEETRATLGVVGVPARNQIYAGDVMRGVAERHDGARICAIRCRPYPGRHPVVVASRRHGGDRLEAALHALATQHGPVERRAVGSALKLCLLAEGAADLYPRLGPTSEWDIAAAQAVLEAAGGAVTGLDGAPLRYRKSSVLNPEFVAVADARIDWWRHFTPPAP